MFREFFENRMLHFNYLKPGSRLDLPEVAGYLDVQSPEFEILAIHPGGMGVCFQIKSLSNLETYALKCIHPEFLGDKNALNRFHDELEVWRSASVCNAVAEAIAIVQINDMPTVLATWMDGGNLTHVLPKLDWARKFETIVRILRALQWAQTKLGVIHRDLKPTNILFDTDSLAYLSDWGLARPLRAALVSASGNGGLTAIDRPDRTQIGSFLGTVTYAAPEQIMNATTVDHRADIYALGCIMFELETGAPPFTGTSLQEIAHKHLHVFPPKLKGLFRQTPLGLARVIERCLAKDSGARYATYDELERDLLAVASRRNFALDRCVISERYTRHQLGKGHAVQQQVIENAPIKGKDVVVMEYDDMTPYLEEASHLMSLGRYHEAEVLLRPFYMPEFFVTDPTSWHIYGNCAVNYALCLQQISGRLDEALGIYATLDTVQEKPAEFYVNYSYALNQAHKNVDAKKVCQQGLAHFPNDLGILGNYTIALMACGDIEEAHTVSMHRLAMRRDVRSLQEAAAVFRVQRRHLRNRDLLQAINLAEKEYSLIKEGLALNPCFSDLRIAEIQFLRFAGARNKALDACQAVMDDTQIHRTYRQVAFLECVEEIVESRHFETALEMIDKFASADSFATAVDTSLQERLFFIKWRIYADEYMIGRDNPSGKRIIIRQVADYFLQKKEEEYPHPVMTARVLEWIGRADEAEELLRGVTSDSDDLWDARKELALLLVRQDRFSEAVSEANSLVEAAPWKAESYDVLSYVADKTGDVNLANDAKKRADETFEKEKELFERLRTLIS